MTDLRNTEWWTCAIRNYGLAQHATTELQHILLQVMAAIANQKRIVTGLSFLRYSFIVADMQRYKWLCPSIGPSVHRSVGPSVRNDWVERCKNAHFWCCSWTGLCLWVCIGWARVWMGVVCSCPPVRNDIVTPRHLFNASSRASLYEGLSLLNA